MKEDDLSYEPPPVLLPCSICSRTFRPEVLDRHSKVCEKTASKKRRVFDSFKSRVSGTELEEFLGPAPLPGQAPKRPEPKSPVKKSAGKPKWKETHENLIAVLRAARGVATADTAAVLAPKNSGNEQCPSCGRFFGPRAFDRHVQFCKEKTSRIKLTPSKVSQAQERLEARTKYKAPLSLKPKLTTKEKYSPMLPRKIESTETCHIAPNKKSPSIHSASKTAKPQPVKPNLNHFSRQSPTRSSERQRSISPKKPLVSSSKLVRESPGRLSAQPKIKDSLKETEDFRPRTGMKMPSHQDRLRISSRKISDIEDDSPSSIKKLSVREKVNRKWCLSSDDGNETDSVYSAGGSTCNSEKPARKGLKVTSPGSPVPKKGRARREGAPTPRTSRDGGSRSSARGKPRLPMINDLSVNDESFGIHVAPCPHRSAARRIACDGGKKPRSRKGTPQSRAEGSDAEEAKKPPKLVLDVVVPSVPAARSSRIPKPVVKGSEGRKEEEESEGVDESAEEESRRDRERTAVIKKSRKWRDIAEVSTEELLHMEDDFDFISELDGLQLKTELETEDSEMEEISRSTLLELTGEEFLKSDDSMECKANVFDSSPKEPQEDEFIVLHVAEPKKLSDEDMHMKLCVSEPCFKTNYPDPNALLKTLRANGGIFVFESQPKLAKMRPRRRNKSLSLRKVKVMPRPLTIRERTFLANDSPRVKKRKLSGTEDSVMDKKKITNISDYFFGHVTTVREENRKPAMRSDGCGRTGRAKGSGKSASEVKLKSGKCDVQQETVVSEAKQVGSGEKSSRGSAKKFEYFEIGKDVLLDNEPIAASESGDSKLGGVLAKENKEKTMSVKERDAYMEKRNGGGAKKKAKTSKPPKTTDEYVKKCTICYSDEEFEELRQKKEKCLYQLKPKEPPAFPSDPPSPAVSPGPPPEDLPTPRPQVAHNDTADEEEKLPVVDSLEVFKSQSLENITEEEEQQGSTERSIEIEDFIVKKPNKTKIMSRSGNCLEELFPRPPEIVELSTTESTTAVPLSYVVDSLYDLKDEGSVGNRPVRKRPDKGVRLPEIGLMNVKKEKKGKSMSSLVQIWKARKERIEKGTLHGESKMALPEMTKRGKQSKAFQIALLPLVLTQKLAEVAEKFDNSKSKDENYDPFKQAERQMLALLSWPSTADLKPVNDKSQSPKSPYQPNKPSSNLETSPTSAFTKYPGKDEQSPKDMKENVNQKKVQNSSGRLSQSNKRNSDEYSPTYSAADDWEQIFEKHFDLNRNEMNEKMTRSVKSALDGLLKSSQKNMNYSTSPENENSPPRKSRLSEGSVVDEILYTSTPKRPSSRVSSSAADSTFERSSGRKTPSGHRKSSNSSHGRVTPPDDFSDSVGREDRGRKSNRNSGVSLSSLSFCSQASDTTLADEEIMRTNLEIIGVGKSTPRSSKRRFARSQSVFDERNKMLFAKTFDSHFSSSDENEMLPTINDLPGKKSASNNPYPKSVPSRFPRSQSVMDGRSRGDGDHFEERDQVSSPEGSKSRKAKMSGDSAYSSLNRRSPRSGTQTNQQEDRLSSSGSERSLPPLNNDHALKPVSLNFENMSSSVSSKKEQPYKMSKFCHECGSKYPIAVAKFCCECGVRRLII